MSGSRAVNSTLTCPSCGTPLAPGALREQCPACLLNLGLVVDGHDPLAAAASAEPAEPAGGGKRFGDFELRERLGQGGMGVVYRAHQARLNRDVALKMIRAGELANEAEAARFRAEAQAAAALDHPQIVPIYEVGEREGRLYYAMKLIEGRSLAEHPASPAPASPRALAAEVALIAEVARAVHHAHQRGVLHRDLKPGNILLDDEGRPHVTDFGLAKRLTGGDSLTLTSSALGTPAYMAPEQAAGKEPLTTAADVYSLGVMLYERLTSRPPFLAGSALETLLLVRNEEPRSPRLLNPHVDRDLETICLRCLEKLPSRRYGSAEALAEELDRWREHRPILARPVTWGERCGKWARRRPAVAALVLTTLAIAAAGLAGILCQWRAAVAARQAAEVATVAKQEQLWRSQLIEARYYRTSGKTGQQGKALEILRQASSFRPSADLRQEAIAALLLPDLGPETWFDRTAGSSGAAADRDLEHYVPFSSEGKVEVRRARDQTVVAELESLGADTLWVQFAPDNHHVAVAFRGAGGGRLGLWAWRERTLILDMPFEPPGGPRPVFDFTADGRRWVIAGGGPRVRQFEVASGRELEPLLPCAAQAVRVSPGGRRAAVARDSDFEVWSLDPPRLEAHLPLPAAVVSLAWHPNEGMCAIGTYHGLFLWRSEGGAEASPLRTLSDTGQFPWVFFNSDGDLLFAGAWGDATGIWDPVSGNRLLSSGEGAALQLSRDGRSLLAARERQGVGVRGFSPPRGLRRWPVPPALGRGIGVARVDWHPEGRWLVSCQADSVALWDSAHGRVLVRRTGFAWVAAAFACDGHALLTSSDRGVQRWPLFEEGEAVALGDPETLVPPEPWGFENFALARDGRRLAAVSHDGQRGGVVDLSTREVIPLEGYAKRPGTHVGLSPDGRWVVTGSHHGTRLNVYDAETGRHVRDVASGTGHGRFLQGASRVLAAGVNEYSFWHVDTGDLVRRVAEPGDSPGFSPDDRYYLLNAATRFLHLRDSVTDADLAVLAFPASMAWSVAFSPDGQRFIAANSTPQLFRWDLAELRGELAKLGLDW